MELIFKKASTKAEIKKVFNYTIDAFSDSPDFKWTIGEIQNEVDNGWELYSASSGDEIIAAVFLKIDGEALLTKNTSVQILHQGSGNSHKIKEFFEEKAIDMKLKRIYHYCRIDNFRMYSLNESHGYSKTDNKVSDGLTVEWVKKIS